MTRKSTDCSGSSHSGWQKEQEQQEQEQEQEQQQQQQQQQQQRRPILTLQSRLRSTSTASTTTTLAATSLLLFFAGLSLVPLTTVGAFAPTIIDHRWRRNPFMHHATTATKTTRRDRSLSSPASCTLTPLPKSGQVLLAKRKKPRDEDHNDDDGMKFDDDDDRNGNGFIRSQDWDILQSRLTELRRQLLEQSWQQPPHTSMSATQTVKAILHALWYHDDPLPDAGFRCLLRSSTTHWKKHLFQAVGAPLVGPVLASARRMSTVTTTTSSPSLSSRYHLAGGHHHHHHQASAVHTVEQRCRPTTATTATTATAALVSCLSDRRVQDLVATALGEAMRRLHNQYAILVSGAVAPTAATRTILSPSRQDEHGDDDDSNNNNEEPSYVISFPSDVLDYQDGTCWVECHLHHRSSGQLLAMTGWTLHREEREQRFVDDERQRDHHHDNDDGDDLLCNYNPLGPWLIHHVVWQDFRDEFSPGVGREEWMWWLRG